MRARMQGLRAALAHWPVAMTVINVIITLALKAVAMTAINVIAHAGPAARHLRDANRYDTPRVQHLRDVYIYIHIYEYVYICII